MWVVKSGIGVSGERGASAPLNYLKALGHKAAAGTKADAILFSSCKRHLPSSSRRPPPCSISATSRPAPPYTPRHNGKVERRHREEQKRLYSCHSFFFSEGFAGRLAIHNRRSNNFLMPPLRRLFSFEFAVQYV